MPNYSTSSGLQTTSAVIVAAPCSLAGVTVIAAAADTTVIVYDSEDTTTSGRTILEKVLVKASTASERVSLSIPKVANRGLYVTVAGAAGEFIIDYIR